MKQILWRHLLNTLSRLLGLVFLLDPCLILRADPLGNWSIRLPLDPGPAGTKVVYGNGFYVSVGIDGSVTISTDTTNWVNVPVPTTDDLTSVAYGNGVFVAVGNAGTILTSIDAISWARHDLGTNASLRAIVFGKNRFVVVGNGALGSGYAAISGDGKTWVSGQPLPISVASIEDVAFGNGVFVAVTSGWLQRGAWSSEDGLSWSPTQVEGFSSQTRVVFGNGVFVQRRQNDSEYYYTSEDGTNWTWVDSLSRIDNGSGNGLCFGNGIFVAISGTALSRDGRNWFRTGPVAARSFDYANGHFFALDGDCDEVRLSEDALNWRTVDYTNAVFDRVDYAGGAFIAFGPTTARSTNGIDWEIGGGPISDVRGFAYGNGIYIAANEQGIHTSVDGLNWSVPDPDGPRVGQIAYGNGWFVSHEGSLLKRSVDGTNWVNAVAFPEIVSGVVYGNGRFLAATRTGMLMTSADAVTWTTNYLEVGSVDDLGLGFASGVFFLGTRLADSGKGSEVVNYTSVDGDHWMRHPVGPNGQIVGPGVVFFNGMYVSPGGGRTVFSTNGVDWTIAQGQYASSFRSIATDGNTAVAAGTALFQSEPFSPTPPRFLRHPADVRTEAGTAALLSVETFGSGPLHYQWRKDGTALTGETNRLLVIRDLREELSGHYSVVVENLLGSQTSESANLVVAPPQSLLTILRQPVDRSVVIGELAYFAVTTAGGAALHYQWLKDGEPIAGATNSIFVFRVLQRTNPGSYSVTISDGHDTVTSDSAELILVQPKVPLILSGPDSQTGTNGGTVSFEVDAAGVEPLRYQWQENFWNIPDATNRVLTLTNVQTGRTVSYRVEVSNGFGTSYSDAAGLTVYNLPGFFRHPQGVNGAIGVSLSLDGIIADPTIPLPEMQWLKNGIAIPFATNASLLFRSVDVSDAGIYTLVLSNIVGSVSSKPARVSVYPTGPLDRWSRIRETSPTNYFNDVVWEGSHFFAIGYSPNAVSSNGVDWSEIAIDGPNILPLVDLAYGAGKYVAVGGNSDIVFTDSGNLTHWKYVKGPDNHPLSAVAYGNGVFVATGHWGESFVLTSPDGELWTERTNSLPWTIDLVFGDGRFVVGGYGIHTSRDGIEWSRCNTPGTNDLFYPAVAYGNGRFVAMGEAGVIISDDGINWRDSGAQAPTAVYQIVFGDGVFMALGRARFCNDDILCNDSLAVYSSVDGVTWVRRNSWTDVPSDEGVNESRNRIVFGVGRFHLFSDDYGVFTADPVLRLEVGNSQELEMLIWSVTGPSCRIEQASSLDADALWEPVREVVLNDYPTSVRIPPPVDLKERFYRAVLLPVR